MISAGGSIAIGVVFANKTAARSSSKRNRLMRVSIGRFSSETSGQGISVAFRSKSGIAAIVEFGGDEEWDGDYY